MYYHDSIPVILNLSTTATILTIIFAILVWIEMCVAVWHMADHKNKDPYTAVFLTVFFGLIPFLYYCFVPIETPAPRKPAAQSTQPAADEAAPSTPAAPATSAPNTPSTPSNP